MLHRFYTVHNIIIKQGLSHPWPQKFTDVMYFQLKSNAMRDTFFRTGMYYYHNIDTPTVILF